MDSSIHQINHCPLDSAIDFALTYPLDSDSVMHLLNNWSLESCLKYNSGFLLRAGNRLFLPAVQVNVTGCFTEIFAEIIQRMFVCLKVKSHCVYGNILLSPSNQSCEDIWHMLSLRKYTICKAIQLVFRQLIPRNDVRHVSFPFLPRPGE